MIHGLAIQSGGTLRLTSSVGVGTTAELVLPVTTGNAQVVDRPDGPTLAGRPRRRSWWSTMTC